MSKAVLVIDMPENCSKCKFMYEFQGIKKCQLMNVFYCGASRLSQDSFTMRKHEKCPLKPLPEKQKLTFATQGEDMITMGWNAAIEAIEDDMK